MCPLVSAFTVMPNGSYIFYLCFSSVFTYYYFPGRLFAAALRQGALQKQTWTFESICDLAPHAGHRDIRWLRYFAASGVPPPTAGRALHRLLQV